MEAVSAVDNVDTLTMRELAARLNVRHSALYRWVRNRDELFDLISEVMTARILSADRPGAKWRQRLSAIVWAMHDQFTEVHGYATHLSRPHEHNAHSMDRLQRVIVTALTDAGVTAELAVQSWYIYITSVIGWLAFQEQPPNVGQAEPRFELFLGVLLRGLAAREPSRNGR